MPSRKLSRINNSKNSKPPRILLKTANNSKAANSLPPNRQNGKGSNNPPLAGRVEKKTKPPNLNQASKT